MTTKYWWKDITFLQIPKSNDKLWSAQLFLILNSNNIFEISPTYTLLPHDIKILANSSSFQCFLLTTKYRLKINLAVRSNQDLRDFDNFQRFSKTKHHEKSWDGKLVKKDKEKEGNHFLFNVSLTWASAFPLLPIF